MNVNIEMGNLNEIIETSLERNINATVEQVIADSVKMIIDKKYTETIEKIVNEKMEEYIKNYLSTYQIAVGGGLMSKDVVTYTVEEYVNKQLTDILETSTFMIKEPSRYGGYDEKKVMFADFVKNNLDVSKEVSAQLTTFISQTKKDIWTQIKEVFDETTKTMLSETVFNMLMQSDTYSKITNGIKILEGK